MHKNPHTRNARDRNRHLKEGGGADVKQKNAVRCLRSAWVAGAAPYAIILALMPQAQHRLLCLILERKTRGLRRWRKRRMRGEEEAEDQRWGR